MCGGCDRLTRRARGATSNRSLSLALVEGDVTLEKTPFSFTMICRKGTAPFLSSC